jgi:hypothetical protein
VKAITAEDIARFKPLIAAAEAGGVPEIVPIPMAPIALAPGPIINILTGDRGASGVTTMYPRRTVLDCRDDIRQRWAHRENRAVAAVIERCVDELALLNDWYEGLNVE